MFERFTDRARRAVVLAQEEARMLEHNYVGTEHLLLGLIREGSGVAARALETLDISLEMVRQEVTEMIGRGQSAPSGHIPFTPGAKHVLELSLREALALDHSYIGTEHILLGLIRESDGVAAQALVRLGADLETTRARILELLRGYPGHEPPETPGGQGVSRAQRRPAAAGLFSRLDLIEARLAALELRVGTQREEGDQPSLTAELEHLRSLLRQHGIEPDNGAA